MHPIRSNVAQEAFDIYDHLVRGLPLWLGNEKLAGGLDAQAFVEIERELGERLPDDFKLFWSRREVWGLPIMPWLEPKTSKEGVTDLVAFNGIAKAEGWLPNSGYVLITAPQDDDMFVLETSRLGSDGFKCPVHWGVPCEDNSQNQIAELTPYAGSFTELVVKHLHHVAADQKKFFSQLLERLGQIAAKL